MEQGLPLEMVWGRGEGETDDDQVYLREGSD